MGGWASRKYPSFRAYHDGSSVVDLRNWSPMAPDRALNLDTRWMLIILGRMLNEDQRGLGTLHWAS
jgi:hypothetical protein